MIPSIIPCLVLKAAQDDENEQECGKHTVVYVAPPRPPFTCKLFMTVVADAVYNTWSVTWWGVVRCACLAVPLGATFGASIWVYHSSAHALSGVVRALSVVACMIVGALITLVLFAIASDSRLGFADWFSNGPKFRGEK